MLLIIFIPQIQALQILEIEPGFAGEICLMMAVFADAELKAVLFEHKKVGVPSFFSVCVKEHGMSLEHGDVPDTVDIVNVMERSS